MSLSMYTSRSALNAGFQVIIVPYLEPQSQPETVLVVPKLGAPAGNPLDWGVPSRTLSGWDWGNPGRYHPLSPLKSHPPGTPPPQRNGPISSSWLGLSSKPKSTLLDGCHSPSTRCLQKQSILSVVPKSHPNPPKASQELPTRRVRGVSPSLPAEELLSESPSQ